MRSRSSATRSAAVASAVMAVDISSPARGGGELTVPYHEVRYVEARAALWEAGRTEADRNMPCRPLRAAVQDGGADAVAGLAERRVGQPHQMQSGSAVGQRGLDVDDEPVDAHEG